MESEQSPLSGRTVPIEWYLDAIRRLAESQEEIRYLELQLSVTHKYS